MLFFFITVALISLIIATGLYLIYGTSVSVDDWYFGLSLFTLSACLIFIVSVFSVYHLEN